MVAVQEISARIGRTTGKGIAGNMREHYPRWLLQPVVLLLLIANTINIGADLGAMGNAVALLAGGPQLVYVLGFGVVCTTLEITMPYGRYAAVLADIHMPHMDGYELARRLRAAEVERGSTRTPIVAVIANAMTGEEERCLAAGMNAYLLKPVSIEQLRTTLERWLPIRSESSTGGPEARRQPAAAIDREVLAGWLGDDRAAIDSLLGQFCGTAVETQASDRIVDS